MSFSSAQARDGLDRARPGMKDALVIRAGALTCLASTLFALAWPAYAARTTSRATVTIRLISTPKRTVVNDVPPKTMRQGLLSRGDTIRGTSVLRNQIAQFGRASGAIIGSDSFSITVTTPPRARVKAVVRLPVGTIRVAGEADAGNLKALPVVGGTGSYAGARGTCESHDLSGGRTLNIYRLRVP